MAKKVSAKFINSAIKISNIGDSLLNDENHSDWEIERTVFTSKNNPGEKIECSWVMENGKKVKKCIRV